MPTADEILKLLEDGKWHNLEEIRDKTGLDASEVDSVTKFLSGYDIVKLDKEGKKARLSNPTLNFFEKIRHVETKKKRQAAFP